MGSFILRGIIMALLVTGLTLLGGTVWSTMGWGGLSVSQLVDIGLLASCLIGGYYTAKESRVWFLGGVVGAGYVVIGTLLLGLFLPIRGTGFMQVMAEGVIIGLGAGIAGAGGKGSGIGQGKRSNVRYPLYGRTVSDFEDQEQKFVWDTEDKDQGLKQELTADWLEGSEEESRDDQKENQKNSQEDSRNIVWPWEQEETSASKPDLDEIGKDQVIKNHSNKCKCEAAKPWWENKNL